MSKKCNGVNVPHEKRRKSSVEVVKCTTPESVPEEKKLSIKTGFLGSIVIPHVRLERYDITPYLNGNNRAVAHRKTEKNEKSLRGKYGVAHEKCLSKDCRVVVKREDLVKLKASLQPKSDATSSDTDSDTNTDMAIKCKICNKSYNSSKKLMNHLQNKHIIYKTDNTKSQKRVSFSDHVIIHEVKEYHKCRKCPKIFEDYKSLKLHTRKWHKKRKCYICNYCSKNFVDRMFFKVHIKLHCDLCGKLFPTRSKYLVHRRDICRVYKLHKCNTCEESFFRIMDLKDHSYDHTDPCYVCDICKEQFQTKCAIAHHNSFLHSKTKRPNELYFMRKMGTERLYLCKFCDESSVERDVVELHVLKLPDLTNKATTGYKDYYFCEHCMKQFDTETDMLQHKWTHFLKTSDNSQTRPKSILTKRNPEMKTTYNIYEDIPDIFKPLVMLEKVDELYPVQYVELVNVSDFESNTVNINLLKKAVVDPKSKKTIVSRHQCEVCTIEIKNKTCLSLSNDFFKRRLRSNRLAV